MNKQSQEKQDGTQGVMRLYRCTRETPYQGDCPGKTDVTSRQGYYIAAATDSDAHVSMRAAFPDDSLGFTVELWKESIL